MKNQNLVNYQYQNDISSFDINQDFLYQAKKIELVRNFSFNLYKLITFLIFSKLIGPSLKISIPDLLLSIFITVEDRFSGPQSTSAIIETFLLNVSFISF